MGKRLYHSPGIRIIGKGIQVLFQLLFASDLHLHRQFAHAIKYPSFHQYTTFQVARSPTVNYGKRRQVMAQARYRTGDALIVCFRLLFFLASPFTIGFLNAYTIPVIGLQKTKLRTQFMFPDQLLQQLMPLVFL